MSHARETRFASIEADNQFDVVVIGGGVNGIGVYRDLALQGLRVLLVERNDFASGCSAAPSRMIHGGLRYLENGEFDLVRESLEERDALLRNAPHMVRPLPTVIPVTSVFSGLLNSAATFLGQSGKPASRGAVPVKLGLTLYDWVTRKRRVLPRHKFKGARDMRQVWPELTHCARFAAVYHDAWITYPERLCVEMLKDVEATSPGCVALNYAELSVKGSDFAIIGQKNGQSLPIQTRAVVHATGAWLDATARLMDATPAETLVSGTKGSHLIIDHPGLEDALSGHMVYFENVDGRVCIVFPFQGHVLAGSTDIRVERPGRVRCEEDELDYILGSLKQVFPTIEVDRKDVVFSFSGIRPLPKSEHDFTGRISRGHFVKRLSGSVPQFGMVGGKWTTFRAFAEQAANDVLSELGRARLCDTRDVPIGGGRNFSSDQGASEMDLVREFRVAPQRAAHLVEHYGSHARMVQLACSKDGGDRSLGEGILYTRAEIRYLIKQEYVETLSDIVLRRTGLAITGLISDGLIDAIASVLAEEHNLDDRQVSDQRAALVEELSDFHGVSPETLIERTRSRRKLCA